MDNEPDALGADADVEARQSIWRAICRAAEQLISRCAVSMYSPKTNDVVAVLGQPLPAVSTWQLVEGLSLLTILLRASEVRSTQVILFVKSGPIHIVEDALSRFVWTQQTLEGHISDVDGLPDLIVTTTPRPPTAENTLRIVGVKYVREIGALLIRGEFAKGHDLRVRAYVIWSFFEPPPDIVAAAQGLGIDLHGVGFDSLFRTVLINDPAALVSKFGQVLDDSRTQERFASVVNDTNEEVLRKLWAQLSDRLK